MNILPVGPVIKGDPNFVRYFRDLKRWNFDIAYNAFYAFRMKDVREKYAAQYRTFTRMARREHVPSCIQIQSTVAHLEDLPLAESQHYHDNSVYQYQHFEGQGKVFHFASFGSRVWLEYLKRLTTLVRGYGFDWIVFEEPMLRTDIPGPDDPIRRIFAERYPDLECPNRQDETAAYIALQKVKRDVLVEFYDALTRHARAEGFQRIGIMPWFFTPTFENTPAETWNSCCDTGRLTHLPCVDFIVVRMQPDNLWAQVVAPWDGECSPHQAYYECLAHHCGKPLIMVNNPTDEHSPEGHGKDSLIPMPFFARYTLAAAAAAPQGMSRHWYGANYRRDGKHMALLSEVNALLRRLGPPLWRYAFVFSYAGLSHVYPRPCREVWRVYETFARHSPGMHTFYAESLRECLAAHPHVDTLIFSEWFPIPPDEIGVVENWVRAKASRRIVYVGGRNGYRWGTDAMFDSYRLLPPEMAALWGVDTSKPMGANVTYLQDHPKYAYMRRRMDDAPVVLPVFLPDAGVTPDTGDYEDGPKDDQDGDFFQRFMDDLARGDDDWCGRKEKPAVYQRRFGSRGGRAVFIALSACDARMEFIWNVIRGADSKIRDRARTGKKHEWYDKDEVLPRRPHWTPLTDLCINGPPGFEVRECNTRNGYFVIVNPANKPEDIDIYRQPARDSRGKYAPVWDAGEQCVVKFTNPWDGYPGAFEDAPTYTAATLDGFGIKVLRVITPDEPLVDVDGMILFWETGYPTADSAVVTGIFHRCLTLTTVRRVEAARLADGRPLRLKRLARVEGTVPLHRVELALKTWHDGRLTIQFASKDETGKA